jgi:formylglycine-generating enzyme required for sulfatase activity
MRPQIKLALAAAGLTGVAFVAMSRRPEVRTPDHSQWQRTSNSLGMRLEYIPPGTFSMGSDKGFDAVPVHTVKISGFWMAEHEVTNQQWEQFRKRKRPVEARGDQQPATRLSWDDAAEFCSWLSKKEKKRYRLPTEAEWEYAARGGLKDADWPWGNERASGRATFGKRETTPVGSYPPNGFGLYDMAGNVEEYCSDWYDPEYYHVSPPADPKGPERHLPGKPVKIIRGGMFSLFEGQVWMRNLDPYKKGPNKSNPDVWTEGDGLGIRVVLEADKGVR